MTPPADPENQPLAERDLDRDLLPCPFCAHEAVFGIIEDANHPDNGGHFIQCANGLCGASSNLRFALGDDPKPLLALAWNNRELCDYNAGAAAMREAAVGTASNFSRGKDRSLHPNIAWDDMSNAVKIAVHSTAQQIALLISSLPIPPDPADALRAENKRLSEALHFYMENWERASISTHVEPTGQLMNDKGAKARAALGAP